MTVLAPAGVELGDRIGTTDRGELWWGHRRVAGDRLLRFLDPYRCDERFRASLARLRQCAAPGMLRVASAGWVGVHYCVEYEVDAPPLLTLDEVFGGSRRWWQNLAVVRRVRDAVPRWRVGPVHPLGLSTKSLLVAGGDHPSAPRLAACPPIESPPDELIGVDLDVLAARSPESVRGVAVDPTASDIYALGTLAAQAIGWSVRSTRPADCPVTIQARGALLALEPDLSLVGAVFGETTAIRQLVRAIRQCRHTSPDARHPGDDRLGAVLADVSDPEALANALPSDFDEGLLDLGAIDAALEIAPAHIGLRWCRCRARLHALRTSPPGPDIRERAEDLLRELDIVRALDASLGTRPWLLASEVRERTGDLDGLARELRHVVTVDGADLASRLTLLRCCISTSDREEEDAIRREAHGRIDDLQASSSLTTEEATQWRSRFDNPIS